MLIRRSLIVALPMLALSTLLQARESYPGQYAQLDPAVRGWIGEQHVPSGPTKGMSCCSTADGTEAQEDIQEASYVASFTVKVYDTYGAVKLEFPVRRMIVPKDAVLDGPFPARLGEPIVWYWIEWDNSRNFEPKRDENGQPIVHIRCYKPGAGA